MELLLAAGVISSLFWGATGDSAFIYVGSDSTTCLALSKLNTTLFGKDNDMALHCVLDEDEQLGIGYLKKIWIPREHCPFYRKDFDVLDYRPCVAVASACPNDTEWYLSTDVYKYQGCLEEKTTTIGSTQTRRPTTEDSNISSQCPWRFVWPIVLGLLILMVFILICESSLARLKKYRKRKLKYRDQTSEKRFRIQWPRCCKPCLTTSTGDYSEIMETRASSMQNEISSVNMSFQSSPRPFRSTWPMPNTPVRTDTSHVGKNVFNPPVESYV